MFERLKNILLSTEYSIQERFFQLTGIFGTIASFSVLVINIITGQSVLIVGGLAIACIVFVLITAVMMRTKRYTLVGTLAVFFSNMIILPFGFLTGGGVFSGSPVWLLIYYILTFMMFEGRLLALYIALTTISTTLTVYVSAAYPTIVVPLTGPYAMYYDTLLSVIMVGLLFGAVIKLQMYLMRREKNLAEEQRREIEKLVEAQNRFFSSMSHEIRTPINSIIGLNEMTLRDKDLPEEVIENAVNIRNASGMLLSLINDILDLSKLDSGRMEVIEGQYETASMLSEIVNLLWNRAREKGLRFNINIGDMIPSMLYGDEMRIKQIIINLLTNAIKYTAEGSVTLTVGGEEPEVNLFLLKIDVEDTGIGIRKESIPFLFDSFKRVDEQDNRAIEGTGLGLSIAKQLTDLMGGHISVDSIYTKGSTFHVELPQKIVNETPISIREISEVKKEAGDYMRAFEAPAARVLVVDDNEMNRLVVAKLLRDTLVKVDLASSGAECLAMTTKTHYDVIFMDHEMPEMDGLETLGKVRNQPSGLCRATPVVALTANAGSDMNAFYMEHGFQAYLAKPIHTSLLEATLLQLLPSEMIEQSDDRAQKEEESLYVGHTFRKYSILITTDCVCDLPQEVLDEYRIRVMPFYVITEAGRFRDTDEIDADNLFAYLGDRDEVVQTASGDMEEYETFFADALADADSVIHVAVSSTVSHSYEKALRAADSFDNVYVIDSRNLSSGLGMVALQAARMVLAGEPLQKILSSFDTYIPLVQTSFIVTRPSTILRRRKIPHIVKLVTEVFGFSPVFSVRRGKLRFQTFKAGYVGKPYEQYVKDITRDIAQINPRLLFVTYSGCDAAEREEILALVKKYTHFDEIIMQKASATVSSQCGMHAFGLIYARRAG